MALTAWNTYKNLGWGCGELVYRSRRDSDGNCTRKWPLPSNVQVFWQGGNVKWIEGVSEIPSKPWSKGATIVTGLDTLFIMKLTAQFQEGLEWIQDHLYINNTDILNIRRTIPTYIGGLLSCYFLTYDAVFVSKANQIVSYFYPEFSQPFKLRRNYYFPLVS